MQLFEKLNEPEVIYLEARKLVADRKVLEIKPASSVYFPN